MTIASPFNGSAIQTALSQASVNSEPGLTLFKNTTIGGRPLGDINNSGTVSSFDTLQYSKWRDGSLTDTDYLNWINNTMHPYMLSNPSTYASYITPASISLSQIQTEFGGSNPISLSEYYRGGGIVRSTLPDGSANINTNVPASGLITMSNFYSGQGVFVFTSTISVHTANYNLNSAMTSAGWNGVSPVLVNVTIDAAAIVYSNQYNGTYGDLITGNNIGTGGTPAFYVGTLPANSTVTIQNNGTIAGSGGLGGIDTAYVPANGGAGCPGFVTYYAGTTQVNNSGTILGGGGGGGAGSLGPPYSGFQTNVPASYAGGYGGPGGAGLVSFNGLLIINNNHIIGGGGGGGNGGQGLAWSSSGCGATGNPYYLSEGSGGGGGGRSAQDFAPAQGGAIGRPFYCSGFVRERNSAAGSNGRIDDTVPAGGLGGRVSLGGGTITWTAGQGGAGSAVRGDAGAAGGDPLATQLPALYGTNSNPPGRGGYSVYGATSTGGSFVFQNTGAIFGSLFDE